jgi:outer membrane protein, adhesin transport system
MFTGKFPTVLTLTLLGGMVFAVPSFAETLQDAVKKTIETHPDVRAVAHNRLARDEEIRQARAGYFPTLDIEAGAGKDYVKKPFDDDLDPRQIRIGLRQNLFAGFSTKNEVGRQQARVHSQAYVVRSTAENTALRTVDVYLEVLKNEAIAELARENLTLHERIADQIRLRSESGVDRRADMDQIQSRYNLAHANVVVAEQNLADARTNYLVQVGHLPGQLTLPEIADTLLPATLQEAEEAALAAHPQLKSAYADVEARRMQDEVAKSPFMPIIDFEIDKIYEEDTNYSSYYDNNREREDLRLFVRMRYNLFNGWHDQARKNETVELINEAREIRNHTHRQVIESIRLSWQAHEAANMRTGYLEQRRQFASATTEAYAKQWNIGQRTLLDVLDAEAERLDAARQLVTAKYDGLYARYRIMNSTGRLVTALQLEWPEEGVVENDDTPYQTDPGAQF